MTISKQDQALIGLAVAGLLYLGHKHRERITVPGYFDPSAARLQRGAGFGPQGEAMGGPVAYEHLLPREWETNYPHLEGGSEEARWTGTGA